MTYTVYAPYYLSNVQEILEHIMTQGFQVGYHGSVINFNRIGFCGVSSRHPINVCYTMNGGTKIQTHIFRLCAFLIRRSKFLVRHHHVALESRDFTEDVQNQVDITGIAGMPSRLGTVSDARGAPPTAPQHHHSSSL